MTPELLAMLTPEERAAHDRLTLDRATYAVENGADDPTCASCGVPVSVRDGCDFEPGEDVCDSCAHLRNTANTTNLSTALTTIATLRAELRAVADLVQEVGVLGIASTMDAVVVSGQPSARDLLTWAAKAMDAWPKERQTLRDRLVMAEEREREMVVARGIANAEIAELRAEHAAYRANADDLFQEMRVRGEALQRDLRDAEPAASVEASEADRLREVATLRETLAEQQRAFVIGLDLAQRTADAEIAGLRATIAPYLAGIERGQGVPPVAGFSWCMYPDRWQYDNEVERAGCRVNRIGSEWRYSWSFWRVGDPTEDPWPSGYAPTAFACMIAAKAALDAWNIAHPYTPEPA